MRNPRLATGLAVAVAAAVAVILSTGKPERRQPGSHAPPKDAPAPAAKKRPAPAPMFSPAYHEALQDILDLEPADVTALEERLAKDPDDFASRLKLLAYCMRGDRAGRQESRARRVELVLWLAEHRPDSEILSSPYASLEAGDLKPDQLQRAMRLWNSAIEKRPTDARVLWNAARFYQRHDRGLHAACLEKAAALAPDNEHYSRELGMLYAGAIISADPHLARRAMRNLETSVNAIALEAAVRLLQSEYNRSLMMGRENSAAGELAQKYFRRAKALDPDLDESRLMPKLDKKMVGMFVPGAAPPQDLQPRFDAAAREIRRVSPDAFPELPAAVASVLRSRGCLIPQPAPDGEPRNVARGEFFEKGKAGWAALCSAGGFSSILVFRNDADTAPEELARQEDKGYLQDSGGVIVYSREIRAVDRKFIMTHYRAYGGPEPPPIDHHGIDDAFLEKASITYYRHRGKWLALQGAD